MPNHCHNRVEFYSEDTTAILKLHAIFNKGLADDIKEPVDTVFGSFIPEPNWAEVPLAESDVKEYSFSNPRGEVGELPVYKDKGFGRGLYSLALMLMMTDGTTGESITGERCGIVTVCI